MSIDRLVHAVARSSACRPTEPTSEAALQEAERQLGGVFHKNIRDYFRMFGGLDVVGYELLRIGSNVPKRDDLVRVTLDERHVFSPALPMGLAVVMLPGNGSLYCVTCSDGQDAGVYYADHECDEDEEDRITLEHADFFEWLLDLVQTATKSS